MALRKARNVALPAVAMLAATSGLMLARATEVKSPLTIKQAIETTRIMADWSGNSIFVSPDCKRYVIMLVRGDLQNNGLDVELRVGGLNSLDQARPHLVARLFTSGLGGNEIGAHDATTLVLSSHNPPAWIDNNRVVLFWEDDASIKQLVSIDVNTGVVKYLTRQKTDVVNFSVGPNGELVYGAKAATLETALGDSDSLIRAGFTVTGSSAYGLPIGLVGGGAIQDAIDNFEWFAAKSVADSAVKITMSQGGVTRRSPLAKTSFSASGHFAVVAGTPATIPGIWNKYTELHFRSMLADRAVDPSGGYARQFQEFFVLDISQGRASPLWNVPISPLSLTAWSPSGTSVLVSPTFLPAGDADAPGLAGEATAVVEVANGRFSELPVPSELSTQRLGIRWVSDDEVEFQQRDGPPVRFRKVAGRWLQSAALKSAEAALLTRTRVTANVSVEWRQDMNTPPVLYATKSGSDETSVILDINPKLRTDVALGKVREVRWKDIDGADDVGHLYLPVNYAAGTRYPLVIQTHELAPETEFSLYGPGGLGQGYGSLGPGSPVHLAQLLAGHDIAVLQLGDVRTSRGSYEPEFAMWRYESAVQKLIAEGIVDRNEVAVTGHSRTGWHVEYAIAHSAFPYAAAIASDNVDGSYFQEAFSGWSPALGFPRNGSAAFGPGLADWLESAPPFSAERIRTPLQLQVMSAFDGMAEPVFLHWEMFSRLHYLRKPVELYVAPDILLHGSHVLQNPNQVMTVVERSLDWLCFWLKGEEDPDPAKQPQYAAWRKLRELHDADLQLPRAPEFKWRAVAAGAPN